MSVAGGILTGTSGANPTLGELLSLRFDPLVWAALLALLVGYVWLLRTCKARGLSVPAWKPVLFGVAWALLVLATQSQAITLTLNSMALYMARLMVLAEVVPPLLVLSLPRLSLRGTLRRVLDVLLDPWVALGVWSAIILFWNLPQGFNASIVSNTAAGALPTLYLLGGLGVWAVVLRPFDFQRAGVGNRGWFGLLSALPMMAIASVWLYSPKVLYSPYVSALCLWNLSPLQNQKISGWIMMVAGLPGIALAFAQLLTWLINLTEEPERESSEGEIKQ